MRAGLETATRSLPSRTSPLARPAAKQPEAPSPVPWSRQRHHPLATPAAQTTDGCEVRSNETGTRRKCGGSQVEHPENHPGNPTATLCILSATLRTASASLHTPIATLQTPSATLQTLSVTLQTLSATLCSTKLALCFNENRLGQRVSSLGKRAMRTCRHALARRTFVRKATRTASNHSPSSGTTRTRHPPD